MVESDLVDEHSGRVDVVEPGDPALEPDRDVAETDRTVAGVEQRAGDDPDGVREIDDPGSGRRALTHALRDLEHHGHCPEGFRESAGAGRLLPDAPACKRHRLVREPRCLPSHADLDQHELRAVERAVEVVGHGERPLESLRVEHPPGQPTDDLASFRVDVVEDELFDGQPLVLA